ncbi:serine/threonine-protein kinase pim-1-like [Pimephales promelas]|nr:serine/threonine-protein kinase pim-1-like [Pimephales promelas]
MGQQSSRPNTECVREPCVLLKYTTNTAENHPHRLDETVGTGEIDGGRKEKMSWRRWPTLHFRCRRAAKYDLAQAEKDFQNNSGLYRRFSQAPTSEVVPAAEEQPEEEEPEEEESEEEQPELDVLLKSPICEFYEIGQKLGEGGFGSVYEGTRRVDGLKVAVKFSLKFPEMPYVKVPGHRKPLPNEIGLTLMANKGRQVPEIIKLLDWEDDSDHYIMVMERPSPCMDLFSFVELHGGILEEQTARHVMRQAVRAAQISCERRVFHRDIKLENLLVNLDTMEVKLIDFGCGALMKNTAFDVFSGMYYEHYDRFVHYVWSTCCGNVLNIRHDLFPPGTEVYCPPEVEVYGKYYAKPTTVWSLGILLFAMVCGSYPSDSDLYMINANIWSSPGLSQGEIFIQEQRRTTVQEL